MRRGVQRDFYAAAITLFPLPLRSNPCTARPAAHDVTAPTLHPHRGQTPPHAAASASRQP